MGLYLIVTPFSRPAIGVDTSVENWRNQPGALEMLETVEIHDTLPRAGYIHAASVIIDLEGMRVVKCRHSGDLASIMSAYLNRYSSEILEAMRLQAK